MSVFRRRITVTPAAGGDGAATATAQSDGAINGRIVAIHLDYLDTPPGTTDVTIAGVTAPTQPILTVTDAATDAWFYPMYQAVNSSNTAITNQGTPIFINDVVSVTIAQANNGDGVIATIVYEG